jgi:hypothetical protein
MSEKESFTQNRKAHQKISKQVRVQHDFEISEFESYRSMPNHHPDLRSQPCILAEHETAEAKSFPGAKHVSTSHPKY